MTVSLNKGEKTEDLQYKGLKIIQSEEAFRFGTDAVLLASWVKAKRTDRVIDLGAGTGIIAILVEGRTGAKTTAIDIQKDQCSMAERSVKMNGQCIDVIECDMRTAWEKLGREQFDIAVCNPPYYPKNIGEISKKGAEGFEGAATHELFCTLEEIAESAEKLMKYGGKFYLCCPTARLAEAMTALSKNRMEPKRLRLVAANEDKPPYLALIEAKKGAAPGLIMEKQLNIMDPEGNYTEETNRIYHRENANQ